VKSNNILQRREACCVGWKGIGVLFGGLESRRVASVLFLHPNSDIEEIEVHGLQPKPRTHAGGCLLKDDMVVFGGRTNPNKALGETWRFELVNRVWKQIEVDGPVPRFRHCFHAFDSNQAIMFGGRNKSELFNDAWLFLGEENKWLRLETFGYVPCPRFSFASCIIHINCIPHLLVHGGFSEIEVIADIDPTVYILNLKTLEWDALCFLGAPKLQSHSAYSLESGSVIFLGGLNHNGLCEESIWKFDVKRGFETVELFDTWKGCLGHGIVADEKKLNIIGGGYKVFAFGQFYHDITIIPFDMMSAEI